MATQIQLMNRAPTTPLRREGLENLHDGLLNKTIGAVENSMIALQQIASSRNEYGKNRGTLALKCEKEKEKETEAVQQIDNFEGNASTRLMAHAFSEDGVFSASVSKARYASAIQITSEHVQTKKLRSDFLYEKKYNELKQLDSDRDRLTENLLKFSILYDRKQDELLDSDTPEQILLLLSEIDRMRIAIRAQLEELRGLRARVSEDYEKEIEKIEGKNCDATIQAIYEPYNKRKKELDEAMQIACDQDKRESERVEKELKEALEIVSAGVDNSCKLLSHISEEISNEHKQELERWKLKMEAVEKSCNFMLVYRKQEHEEEMAEKKHRLECATLLLAKDKQEKEQELALVRFTSEYEQNRNALALEWDKEISASQHRADSLDFEKEKAGLGYKKLVATTDIEKKKEAEDSLNS